MEIINENKLYQVVNRFFTDPRNLLGELIQNAYRAKADKIEIVMGKKKRSSIPGEYTLYIQDNGTGINDLKALLGIAYSDWDEAVEMQEPAGMGFLQLISSAHSVKIHSAFGSLLIDCDRFLNDAEYRRQLISRKQKPDPKRKGTTILAQLKQAATQYMHSDKSCYSGFEAQITINGETVEHYTLNTVLDYAKSKGQPYILCMFQDNRLIITLSERYSYQPFGSKINWYGQFIPYQFSSKQGNSIKIYYEVKKGTPLTPVYPDRASIAKDNKLLEFDAFIRREVTSFIKEYIMKFPFEELNDKGTHVSLLHTFYSLCTEEEAKQMPWIPVMKDAFDYSDYPNEVLMLKSDMSSYHFCAESLHVDSAYRLAGDFPLPVLRINPSYRMILRELELKEITDLYMMDKACDTIIQNPLKLKIEFYANKEEECELKTAVICDYSNDFHVYGTDSSDIYRVFMQNYDEIIGNTDSFDSIETQQEDAFREFLSEYEMTFSVVNRRNFSFLPNYSQVKSITFDENNIRVHYLDDSDKEFLLKEL